MEEKERYKLNSFDDIYDNEFDDYLLEDFQTSQLQNIVDLLNQQDEQIKELDKENQQLKQQLAEKDKEIEYYKKQVKKLNNEAQKYFEDAYCNDFQKQDKISFCIEKFQETKKSLRDKVCLMGNDTHCYLQNAIHWQDVVAIIDNQIASLKNEMK